MYTKVFKWMIVPALFVAMSGYAQDTTKKIVDEEVVTPNNWHLLDRDQSGFYGISLDKAYQFLKGRKSNQVIVAVIDSGVDTLQEDLKPVLWHNPGEIPNNGIDDDGNGYVDDYYGWNFLGNKDGTNVKKDSDEASRVYWSLKSKYPADPDTTALSGKAKEEAIMYLKAKKAVLGDADNIELLVIKRILPMLKTGDSIIAKDLGKEEYSGNDLKTYVPSSRPADYTRSLLLNIMELNNNNYDITNKDIINDMDRQIDKEKNAHTPPPNYRNDIVGDNYNDINDRFYGNSDVMTGSPSHGTHVSGIIGAMRNNGLGMDGIADNVKIMMIRAVPEGDEHDKDIANSIRYAVDNGARIISMSFGKGFSPQKKWVDDAIKYAASKDVLLIHAAGNDSKDIDIEDNFPNKIFQDGTGEAKNFITVGASGDPTNGGFTASFSNYGKKQVDVFAPGVNIYSTLPGGNVYGKMSGTSMAAPVVSGIAALLLQYFPDLSAEQLKYVIMNSVTPIRDKMILPGTQTSGPEMVTLSDISKSGGEVNAYNAVVLASKLKGERKVKK